MSRIIETGILEFGPSDNAVEFVGIVGAGSAGSVTLTDDLPASGRNGFYIAVLCVTGHTLDTTTATELATVSDDFAGGVVPPRFSCFTDAWVRTLHAHYQGDNAAVVQRTGLADIAVRPVYYLIPAGTVISYTFDGTVSSSEAFIALFKGGVPGGSHSVQSEVEPNGAGVWSDAISPVGQGVAIASVHQPRIDVANGALCADGHIPGGYTGDPANMTLLASHLATGIAKSYPARPLCSGEVDFSFDFYTKWYWADLTGDTSFDPGFSGGGAPAVAASEQITTFTTSDVVSGCPRGLIIGDALKIEDV